MPLAFFPAGRLSLTINAPAQYIYKKCICQKYFSEVYFLKYFYKVYFLKNIFKAYISL